MKPYFSDKCIKSINFMHIVTHSPGVSQHMVKTSEALIFAVSGRLEYRQGDRSFMTDRSGVLLRSGDSEYDWISEEDNSSMVIEFDLDPKPTDGELFLLDVGNNSAFEKLFRHIYPYWNFKKPAYELYCRSALYEMLAMAEEAAVRPPSGDARFEYIRRSVEYMEANYGDPELTNELLARQSSVSTVYFRKLFTEKYGMPPMKFLGRMRMNKAKELLLFGDEGVARVAEAVCCGSIYNFSRAFKRATGLAPSEYSRLYGTKNK